MSKKRTPAHRKQASARKKKKTQGRRAAMAKPSAKPSRPASLDEWLDGVRTFAASAETTGKPRGACLVPDPNGGPSMCVVVDRDTCKLMKGTFIGGPC
jgi:hypothetical protein